MSVGDILGDAWDLYKRFWRHLVPLAVVLYALLGLVTLLLTVLFGLVGAAVAAAINLLGVFLIVGALVEAIADVRDGRADLTYAQTVERVRPRFWALVGAGLIATLGIVVGLVLLVIPGLILATRWSVFAPLVVLEGVPGTEALGQSNRLVRGRSWTVFGVLIITIVLVDVVVAIINAILSPLADWLQSYVSNVVGSGITAPFAAVAITLMYFRLKEEKAIVQAAPAVSEG